YQECLKHLDELRVPAGFEIEKIVLRDVHNLAASYNLAIKTTEAKYKVYLHQETLIIHKNFLLDLIKLFKDQPGLGMVGVLGSKTIPTNGVWWDSNYKYGKVYKNQTGTLELKAFAEVRGEYEKVRALDGMLLSTQYDVHWREDLFDTQLYSELAQVLEINRAGYVVVVPQQVDPWCRYNGNFFVLRNEDEAGRNQFLDEYSKDLFPLVSIQIPTHNRLHYLELALNTALKQTYRNTEIIISDNGDDEASRKMREPSLEMNPKFKYFRKKGMTVHENFQKCQELATGEYHSLLMDDDLFHPDKTMRMMHYFLEYENIGLVTSYRQLINETGAYLTSLPATRRLFDQDTILNGNDLGNIVLKNQLNVIGEPTTVLFKAEDLSPGYGYFLGRKYKIIADLATWLNLTTNRRCVYISEALSFFRLHQGQDQQQIRTQIEGECQWWYLIKDSHNNGLFLTNRKEYLEAVSLRFNRAVALLTENDHLIKSQNLNVEDLCHCIEEAKKELVSNHLPLASIIIVTYNSLPDVKQCVSSIVSNTSLLYELIIVDNSSTDGTQEYLKTLANAKTILNSTNNGFSRACNQGIKEAEGDYIVLLNPDTAVTKNWDARMIAHFKEGVGAVGPVSNYVAGLQKFEFYKKEPVVGEIDINTLAVKLYQWNRGQGVETKLLIGFCLMIKKEVIEKIGMLDEDLFLGNDDLEYSLRLRNNGYKLLVATDTFIYHKGQASFKSEPSAKTKAIVQESTDILYKKLVKQYGSDHVPSSQELWGIDWFKPCQQINSKTKLTSIIILTHNQLEYTKKCINSIFKHTRESFELIVVDNGSTDGTVEYLESEARGRRSEVGGQRSPRLNPLRGVPEGAIQQGREVRGQRAEVRIIKNKENLGFAAGNNQGMAEAKGDYVLLMNNDLVVTPGWLGRLIACAERRPQIGIVGPVSNYVSGPQLIKDVSYDTTSLARLNKFSNAFSKKHEGQTKPFWRVVGFCMLIKRAVIDKIGGLDGRFGLGNFEDDDFSLRAALAGFESWIAQDCFVHHFGSRTFVGAKIDYRESLHKNWEIYKKKWGIPADVAYGAQYDMASAVKDGFIPAKHYCPLTPEEYSVTDGEQLFGMGDIEGARRIFKQVLSVAPNNIEALNNLGVIAFQEGETDQAVSYFTRVLETDENYFEAIENLGKCEEAKKDYLKAAEWFERALKLKPDEIGLLNAMGNCFIQAEDLSKAREVYEKSLGLDGNQESIEIILQELGRLEESKMEE
ncbi:MAG: glycosyltransferase, partial [Spirochaetales bacterium]|nr:glycosyltransferase [Spirochaetales bacterium]